jgi:hypothetical protein
MTRMSRLMSEDIAITMPRWWMYIMALWMVTNAIASAVDLWTKCLR